MALSSQTSYIFGGDRLWNASLFTASDDRVRGGASVSHLSVGPSPSDSNLFAATFYGHLDTSALGGAGFASQRTVDPFSCDLSGATALVADIIVPSGPENGSPGEPDPTIGRTFTITLKNDILPQLPDGREQSTVSWEYDFRVRRDEEQLAGQTPKRDISAAKRIEMPIADFKPTYRGRPVEDGSAKLDLANIRRISFMMRSFFDKQDGNFSLTINWLAASRPDGGSLPAAACERSEDDSAADGQPAPVSKRQSGLLGWPRS